jgi:hypothetical protein
MLAMKRRAPSIALMIGLIGVGSFAQSFAEKAVQATVCDIVNNPLQFKGRLVQVRAQVWPDIHDYDQIWMNESPVSSMQVGKACRFLPAKFKTPTELAGSAAFGTFTGRVIDNPAYFGSRIFPQTSKRSKVMLLIEQESDIYGKRDYLNGPIPILQLYDQQSGSFIRPQ